MQGQSTVRQLICPQCQKPFPEDLHSRRRFCSTACFIANRGADTTVDRFWASVQKTDKCWLWTSATNKNGYGVLRLSGVKSNVLVHRFSYQIHFGEAPDDKRVCHRCDIRNCVRPDHLFLGTQTDNLRDMYKKDRHPKGQDRGHAKLTDEAVQQIRALYQEGRIRQKELARRFGVSQGTVSEIISRKRWTHI